MTLFTGTELGDWLNKSVAGARATVVERVVWGWLSPILGTETRPEPVPVSLFSWAIELGAIAHENPAGLDSQQLGSSQQQFSSERRAEILDEVARSSLATATSPNAPTGSFPEPYPYPDPAW